jgi:hypothetical protein
MVKLSSLLILSVSVIATSPVLAQYGPPQSTPPMNQQTFDYMHERNMRNRMGVPQAEQLQSGRSANTAGSCRSQCSQRFVDCNIAGRPYNVCNQLSDRCLATCR